MTILHRCARSAAALASGSRAALLAVLLVFAASACGGDGGDGPNGPGAGGTMTARVNGASWSATSGILALRVNNFISITGSVGGTSNITIAFPDDGTGTYTIPGSVVGMNMNYSLYGPGHLWQALGISQQAGVGTGSVTVTTLTSERVAGTFQFTAPGAQSSGATGQAVVTDGAFNIRF